jgi:NADPH-dependent 2,4-dienoyl-CoA reductase/sulfur reductase-like enzyme
VTRFVVIGGDAAGMSAGSVARRRDATLDIVAFERGGQTSYSACGLPYFVAGLVGGEDRLIARSPEQHRALGLEVHTRHEVVAIDTTARTVRVRDLDAGRERDESWDQLVIATGATPVRPKLPGADADGIFGIQTIDDGMVLAGWLAEQQPKTAVVVGGGYVGLEMAEAMRTRGIDVTVVERQPQPMSTLDPDMGALVGEALEGLGIKVESGVRGNEFAVTDTGRVRAVVTDQGEVAADVVVLGLGVRPNVALARDAGIAIGESGGVRVDPSMRTSAAGVFAAGDCCESWHRVSRRPVVIPLGTHANKQGRVVGINATGGAAEFPGVIGTAITKVCAYEVARTGLTEVEAAAAGIDAVAARIESTSRASYYPGATKLTVKMVAERGSGRLLGAQIVGQEGAAKRVDVVAAGIWNDMTADAFSWIDLGYAPPYSPVWDPVLVAARKVADLV